MVLQRRAVGAFCQGHVFPLDAVGECLLCVLEAQIGALRAPMVDLLCRGCGHTSSAHTGARQACVVAECGCGPDGWT